MYNFEDILNRLNNGSKKWNVDYIKKRFEIENYNKYFPLFIADMDFKLPDEILNPFLSIVSEGDFGYFDIKESFYNSVIKWYETKYNCIIKSEWIVPSIGAIATMNIILEFLFDKGDNILVFTPVYKPFKDIVDNNQLNIIQSKLKLEKNTYNIDFLDLKDKITNLNVKGIILCNPHNPSGVCWSKKELDNLINICKEREIFIISDEVHGDLVLDKNNFISLSSYLDYYRKIIVVSSPNKTFNIAGLNISTFLCSDITIKLGLENIFSQKKLHPNRLGCECLTICYDNGYNWVNNLCLNIKDNIEIVIDMLKNSDIQVINPNAGYLLWIRLHKVDDIDKFILELAKNTGVLFESGNRFLGDNQSFLRINVATSKEILKEAIKKFLNFYENYKK